MKKYFFAAALVMVSASAMADWEKLGRGQSGTTVYADPATIGWNGEFVTVWTLFDYKTVKTIAGTDNRSHKTKYEFDCKGKKLRAVSFTFYTGTMGSGNVNHTESTPEDWRAISPKAVEGGLAAYACGKQK